MGRVFSFLVWGLIAILPLSVKASTPETAQIPSIPYTIIEQQSHDSSLFTQGMLVHDGWIYESSGRYGQSKLARYKESDSSRFVSQPLSKRIFAEGLTRFNNQFYLITWRAGKAFLLDEYWQQKKVFDYKGEGWGITDDGDKLIMSDGSDHLQFRDPDTFALLSSIKVTGGGRVWRYLNELEYINGVVWANRWQTDEIIAIDPKTGKVLGVLDIKELSNENRGGWASSDKVANGIAWSQSRQAMWITGKYWNKRYLIRPQTEIFPAP